MIEKNTEPKVKLEFDWYNDMDLIKSVLNAENNEGTLEEARECISRLLNGKHYLIDNLIENIDEKIKLEENRENFDKDEEYTNKVIYTVINNIATEMFDILNY